VGVLEGAGGAGPLLTASSTQREGAGEGGAGEGGVA
jgi:hypothetical protein